MGKPIQPMLASLVEAPLDSPSLVYEPKYDGIRAIVEVRPDGPARIWSRLGNDKTAQFPEVASALEQWARASGRSAVLDGEVVALDASGRPIGFQHLQGRIHLKGSGATAPSTAAPSSAFIAFDLLRDAAADLCDRPLTERRLALERLLSGTRPSALRLSEIAYGDGRDLYERAVREGWEGLIAKHAQSRYRPGKRTPDWHKIKLLKAQEFVVGGWTEPRSSRIAFGALLLGVYDRGALVYAGHVGTGFDERELTRLMALLRPLERKTCPFAQEPPSNERPHWVRPTLVAHVKFTEWTADGRLRQPVYLGLRDDKPASTIEREAPAAMPGPPARQPRWGGVPSGPPRGKTPAAIRRPKAEASTSVDLRVIQQLRTLEDSRRDGTIELPTGQQLAVTNLHKVFWPKQKLTKGDLFRYYASVAPFILPALTDRPLVMKRFPNGIAAEPFYQHRALQAPAGVRIETVEHADDVRPQIIGGDLLTLLYTQQLAAISQDPWFSRVQTPQFADYVALDLDPMPGVAFAEVLDVARWIRDELDALDAFGVPKTSGADGLHVYVPLPPKTTYETGLLFCQIVATVVAHKHPKQATVERAVRARGRKVYVDYLQNILGKTLATAYSARASDYAGVSAPLTWDEVDKGVDREAFTIETMPTRLSQVGDLWASLRSAKGVNLARVVSTLG